MNATRRILFVAWVFLLAVSCRGPAAEEADAGGAGIRTVADLNGKRIGILAGTVLDTAADNALDFTNIIYYDNTEAEIRALIAGEIDAFIDDQPVARFLAARDPRLRKVEGILEEDRYGFAVAYGDDEFYDQVDAALGELLADGMLDALEAKWIDSPDEESRVLPEPREEDAKRILRFGVSPVSAPFVYEKGERGIVGLDVELMGMIAERHDRRLIVVGMEFSELIPSLLSGRVDVIGSCLSITEERGKLVRFTRAYYEGGVAAITLAGESAADG